MESCYLHSGTNLTFLALDIEDVGPLNTFFTWGTKVLLGTKVCLGIKVLLGIKGDQSPRNKSLPGRKIWGTKVHLVAKVRGTKARLRTIVWETKVSRSNVLFN